MTNSATAQSVARALNRAGWKTQPRGGEGIHVSKAWQSVTVTAYFDQPSKAQWVAGRLAEILREAGYTVEVNPHDAAILTVSREGSTT